MEPNEPVTGDTGVPGTDLGRRVAAATATVQHPDEVLALALEQVCAFTGWPLGHVYTHESAGAQLLPTHLWYSAEEGAFHLFRRASDTRRFEPGEGLPGRALSDQRPQWIPDVTTHDGFPRSDAAREAGLHAGLAFPIVTAGGVVAVFELFNTAVLERDEDLIEALVRVGEEIGEVFERVHDDEALRERENRFRALAETAADAIVTIDESDRIVYANPACARIFGYSLDELMKMPFTRMMPERLRDRHRAGMRRFAETGERQLRWDGVELPGLHRDGSEIPLEITFGSFKRDRQRLFTGIMRDISDRKRAEEERARLLEAEREARGEAERRAAEEEALREAAAAVSAAFTAEETIRRIAGSALSATRADGAFVERICLGEGEVEVVAVAGEQVPTLRGRRPYSGSFAERVIESERPELLPRLSDSDRSLPEPLAETCAECSAAVIPLLNVGEPVGALVLLRDAGKLGFREDEVERAFTFGELAGLAFRKIHLLEESERRMEELQKVMESRSRLMRGFSHDVKNPLGAADGFLQLLEDGLFGELTDEQLPKLQRARKALHAALGLIDDLLDFARAESGQLEIRPAPTDVREAAREIAEEYMARAEDRGLSLTLDLPEELPIIECDPARIRQIISNLLSNAVKYTPSGGEVVVRVLVECGEEDAGDERILLSVADTGPGIPEDKQHLLFEEFTRLDPEASDGAGIGLAISRRVAQALGGDVLVDTEPGRGSTFTLWVPLKRPGEGGGRIPPRGQASRPRRERSTTTPPGT